MIQKLRKHQPLQRNVLIEMYNTKVTIVLFLVTHNQHDDKVGISVLESISRWQNSYLQPVG